MGARFRIPVELREGKAGMLSEALAIRPLRGNSVFCETPGCVNAARYLFAATSVLRIFSSGMQPIISKPRTLLCSAYCEVHARQHAERADLALPELSVNLD